MIMGNLAGRADVSSDGIINLWSEPLLNIEFLRPERPLPLGASVGLDGVAAPGGYVAGAGGDEAQVARLAGEAVPIAVKCLQASTLEVDVVVWLVRPLAPCRQVWDLELVALLIRRLQSDGGVGAGVRYGKGLDLEGVNTIYLILQQKWKKSVAYVVTDIYDQLCGMVYVRSFLLFIKMVPKNGQLIKLETKWVIRRLLS